MQEIKFIFIKNYKSWLKIHLYNDKNLSIKKKKNIISQIRPELLHYSNGTHYICNFDSIVFFLISVFPFLFLYLCL